MKKRIVLSSVLALLLCASLIAGATFALFTSEVRNNIAIVAGNIEIDAYLSNIRTSTMGVEQATGTFALGGTATYDETDNLLTLDKIAPGDKVTLDLNIENRSNLAVKYRVKVAFDGDLLDEALVATILLPGEQAPTTLSAGNIATDWVEFQNTIDVFPVSIELPVTAGNEYKNKTANVTISVEAVQANGTEFIVSADELASATLQNNGVYYLEANTDYVMPTLSGLEDINVTFVGQEGTRIIASDEGAITIRGSKNATVTVKDVTIVGGAQRGVCFSGQQNENATLIVTDCHFEDVITGIYLGGVANATITNCTFKNCTAGIGGTEDLTGTLTVDSCEFDGNGENIGWAGSGSLVIKDCPTCQNFTDWNNGGAIVTVTGGNYQ